MASPVEDAASLPPAKRVKLEVAVAEDAAEDTRCQPDMAGASNRIVLVLCGSFSPITNLHMRMLGELQ